MGTLQEWYQSLYTSVSSSWGIGEYLDLVLANPETPVYLGVAFTLILVVLIVALSLGRGTRGETMNTQQRRVSRQEKEVIEDALCFAIEEAVFQDKISRKRARYWYKELAKQHGLSGLVLPEKAIKKLHPKRIEKIKGDLKYRLGNGLYKTKTHIPGPKPGEAIKLEVPKKKLEEFFTKRKTAA